MWSIRPVRSRQQPNLSIENPVGSRHGLTRVVLKNAREFEHAPDHFLLFID